MNLDSLSHINSTNELQIYNQAITLQCQKLLHYYQIYV